MARAICPQAGLTGMINLDPSRCALKRIGGINKTIYIGSLSEMEGFTRNTDKEVDTITMKAGKNLYALTGKKLNNSTSNTLKRNENANLFTQTVNFVAFFDTQPEKEAIELLCDQEDLFIFVQDNFGRFEVFGLVGKEGMPAEGMSVGTSEYVVEASHDGSTAMKITFTADESKMSVFTNFGDDALDEIAYLDALK